MLLTSHTAPGSHLHYSSVRLRMLAVERLKTPNLGSQRAGSGGEKEVDRKVHSDVWTGV